MKHFKPSRRSHGPRPSPDRSGTRSSPASEPRGSGAKPAYARRGKGKGRPSKGAGRRSDTGPGSGRARVTDSTQTLAMRLDALTTGPDYTPLTGSDLARALKVPPHRSRELQELLDAREQAGRLTRIKEDGRYVAPVEVDLIPGRIRMNRQGKGFLQPDDQSLHEIMIPEHACSTALHEDRVLVRRDVPRLRAGGERGAEAETGVVVRILERRRSRIVGTFQQSRQFMYVVPDDPRIGHDIYVSPPRDLGRLPAIGDKVVVELREWVSRHTNPEGEIVEWLGKPDAEGVDMLSVLRQYDLPLSFPEPVLEEARAHGTFIQESDLRGRTDCRTHQVVTIDPDDAKDFDDAICLEPAGDGRWRLWVHIADVSHYVKPGTALDTEARKRGNSTYLVDRVIPMLPEALSNELCSLKPGVDRLTKCVEFLLGGDGKVLETQFYPAVICSKRRFSYQEALAVLQRSPDNSMETMLHRANEVAQKIRRARFKAGALELDFPEMKIRLDEHGKVVRLERMENDISHQLIEEFMLLANEAVAARLIHLGQPSVHRIHEEPDQDRLQEYREEVLAHHVPCGDLRHRSEIQKLLSHLLEIPIGSALRIGFLKSLMRARYSMDSLGHYGLAKVHYTHFTSPIRRYADLVVHRSLFERGSVHVSIPVLREIADHISVTERNSADAERDSRDVKLFAFLEAQIASGEPTAYEALVTDVRNFGFFVDIPELAMGGLVPLSEMGDDFYVFEESRRQLVGRRLRRTIRLGDRIRVVVAKINRFKKQVDYRMVTEVRREERGARFGREVRREERRGEQGRSGQGAPSRTAASDRSGGRMLPSSHRAPLSTGRDSTPGGQAPARSGESRNWSKGDGRDSRGGRKWGRQAERSRRDDKQRSSSDARGSSGPGSGRPVFQSSSRPGLMASGGGGSGPRPGGGGRPGPGASGGGPARDSRGGRGGNRGRGGSRGGRRGRR